MPALDTSTLPRSERADAIITHMREIALASHVVLDDPPNAFMTTTVYAIGAVQLIHLKRSGLFMDVDRERDDRPPTVAMMLGTRSPGVREQFGHVIEQRAGVVDMIELHRPHTSWSPGNRNGWVLQLPTQALALPTTTLTRARPALGTSPLQQVFASYLRMLTRVVPLLTTPSSAADLGTATLAFSRAVLSAAAGDEAGAREALHPSLWPRIQVFVREHIRDPDLNPQMIASAHHISVRLLYRVLADAGVQLEQVVIEQRLEGARADLIRPTMQHRTIAAVALAWGFSNPSFFSSRFHQAFGLTPREWRAAHTRAAAPV